MLVLKAKIKGRAEQFEALDEAMRTFRFIQNSCLRYWMDNSKVSRNDLYKYCRVLADNADFPWAVKLNSQARQAAAERAWSAIARFYDNCKKQIPGKKGYLRSCTILNKWVSAALRAAETHIYRSRAPRANGKCERCKI